MILAWSDIDKNSYTLDQIEENFINFNIKNLKDVRFGVKYHLRLQKLAHEWNMKSKNYINNI